MFTRLWPGHRREPCLPSAQSPVGTSASPVVLQNPCAEKRLRPPKFLFRRASGRRPRNGPTAGRPAPPPENQDRCRGGPHRAPWSRRGRSSRAGRTLPAGAPLRSCAPAAPSPLFYPCGRFLACSMATWLMCHSALAPLARTSPSLQPFGVYDSANLSAVAERVLPSARCPPVGLKSRASSGSGSCLHPLSPAELRFRR